MERSGKPRVTSLDHLVLTVTDIMTTRRFYEDVLGMESTSFEASDGMTRWALRVGAQKINLHQAGREFSPKARQAAPGTADLCFLSDTAIADWLSYLLAHGTAVETGPVPRMGATGPLTSIYLRDPDGNLIELSNPACRVTPPGNAGSKNHF